MMRAFNMQNGGSEVSANMSTYRYVYRISLQVKPREYYIANGGSMATKHMINPNPFWSSRSNTKKRLNAYSSQQHDSVVQHYNIASALALNA